MIPFIILFLFFLYSILLFFINNYFIFLIIFIFNIIISIFIKIPLIKHLYIIKKNLLFIIFIFICNIIFNPLNVSIIISIRLFLIIDFTYIINNYFNSSKLQIAFNYLLTPLKLFNIDTNKLSLIISISLALIPVLRDETISIKYSLKSKGFEFNLKNAITRPSLFLITYLNNLFDRLNDLEKALIVKAY